METLYGANNKRGYEVSVTSKNRKNLNEILKDIPYSRSAITSNRMKELQDFCLIQRHNGAGEVSYSLSIFCHNVKERLLPLAAFG